MVLRGLWKITIPSIKDWGERIHLAFLSEGAGEFPTQKTYFQSENNEFAMVLLNMQFSHKYFYNYPVSVMIQFLEQWDFYCIAISVIIDVYCRKLW